MNKFSSTLTKCLLSLIVLFLLVTAPRARAEAYPFIISANRLLVDYKGEIEIDVSYELLGYKEENFRIRPITKNGISRIYNPKNNQWISENDLWLAMPFLQKNIKFRIPAKTDNETVHFRVLNLENNELYKSNQLSLWTYLSYGKYLEMLNLNIKNGKIP